MKTAPVKRKDSLREKICYYIDDRNIPEEIHERITYLGTSRNFLTRVVIRGYRFLRERHLEYDFKEWYRKQEASDFRESGYHMQGFDKRKQPIFHFSEREKEKNRLYFSGKTGFQSDFMLPVFRKYETKTKALCPP